MTGLHELVNARRASATILPFGETSRQTVVHAFSID